MRSLFVVLSFVFTICIHASPISWDGQDDYVEIGKKIKLLEDKDGLYSIEQVWSPEFSNQFKQSDKNIINLGFTESIYWLKFTLQNNSSDSLFLEIAAASSPITEIYYKNKEGGFTNVAAGYQIPMNDKKVIHHFQIFPLPHGTNDIYIRVLSNTQALPIKIWNQKTYSVATYRQRLGYGFYIGFMLFVVITNLFFFFSLRNRIYLFYAFVVFIYSCYASMVVDGFILYLFPRVDMMFWYLTIPTIGVTVQTAYCLTFLEVKKYGPKTARVVRFIVLYFLVYLFIRPFLSMTTALAINTVHALLSFFIMGYVGIRVGIKGNRMGFYYATAYFIYFLLVVTEAIYIQTGAPRYLMGLSYVALATLIEAFILSYLLSKRSEWERKDSEREKHQAQEQLFKTVQENERIVKEQNVILEKEVSKRTKSLNRVNKELEVAIATKDKFFSIIAHDLKSPFNSLLGISDLLITGYNNYSELEKIKYLKILSNGLVNTHNLLDNLLLWSQSQRGSLVFNPEQINLQETANDIIDYLKQQAESKSITLHNKIEGNLDVLADRNMLLTVLRNLVTNAIKFTPKGGDVEVDVNTDSSDNRFATICIRDNGLGISQEQQSKLFNLSTNVSTNGTNNESGTGLGLIICKEFVERHGGKIWVESEFGRGALFCLNIPVSEIVIS